MIFISMSSSGSLRSNSVPTGSTISANTPKPSEEISTDLQLNFCSGSAARTIEAGNNPVRILLDDSLSLKIGNVMMSKSLFY